RSGSVRTENLRLAGEIAALRRQIGQGVAPAQPVQPEPVSGTAQVPQPPASEPAASEPVASEPIAADLPPPFDPASPPPPPVPVFDVPSSPAVAPLAAGWEHRLGARAFIWVGAITLALSAIFLVRYSIEEGYLSPEVRVILAALFGFALVGGAEKMKP